MPSRSRVSNFESESRHNRPSNRWLCESVPTTRPSQERDGETACQHARATTHSQVILADVLEGLVPIVRVTFASATSPHIGRHFLHCDAVVVCLRVIEIVFDETESERLDIYVIWVNLRAAAVHWMHTH